MKRKVTILFLVVLTLFSFTSCKNKDDNKTTVTPVPSQAALAAQPEAPATSQQPAPTAESTVGKAKSLLTGTLVDENLISKRPYAVMINNIDYAAKNHCGLSNASIVYEALVEGSITRLMAVFEDFKDVKKIGSVRSARHYFVSIADEYDAIFVHFGQTKYAVAKMKTLGTDNLSGTEGIGSTVFYRVKNLHPPHNAFASYKGIMRGVKAKKYRTDLQSGYEGHYTFYDNDTDLTSNKNAKKVVLPFSNYAKPYFKYNADTKTYYRYSFGAKHIDNNNGEQLNFKNVIIQYVKEWNIDRKGYQTMDIENASGKGWYISNGKAVKITWKKNEAAGKMRYYDKNGNELTINPGKTYVGVFPVNRKSEIKIK